MLEKSLEKRLREGIKKLGGRCYKFVSPGNAGVPDRIVVLPGKVLFVELKADTGQLTKLQRRQIYRLELLGCRVFILRGADHVDWFLDQCRKFVEERSGDD